MSEASCTVLVRRRAASCLPELDEWNSWLPCEACGTFTNRPERHHRQFRSRGGLWIPSNVILLCGSCHVETTAERHPSIGLNVATWEVAAAVTVTLWWWDELVYLRDDGSIGLTMGDTV